MPAGGFAAAASAAILISYRESTTIADAHRAVGTRMAPTMNAEAPGRRMDSMITMTPISNDTLRHLIPQGRYWYVY